MVWTELIWEWFWWSYYLAASWLYAAYIWTISNVTGYHIMVTFTWWFIFSCIYLMWFLTRKATSSPRGRLKSWLKRRFRRMMMWEKRPMRKKGQLRREEVVVGDMITDGIEDMILREVLSPDRANYWYKRIAKGAGLTDLLQRRVVILPHPEQVKRQIKDRRGKKNSTKPIPFPDPTPKTITSAIIDRVFNGSGKKAAADDNKRPM